MNEFRLIGRVVHLDERVTARGNRWVIAQVQDDLGELVPVALFGRLPRVGDQIDLSGSLAGYRGFLNLKIEEKVIGGEIDRRAAARRPVGAMAGAGAGPGGGWRGIPETSHFEENDDLPF